MSNSAEIELCFSLGENFDFLGLITWFIVSNKITVAFCFDDENIDIYIMPYVLDEMVENSPQLLENGWQPDFKMVCQRVEEQVNFTEKVIFVLEK